VNQDEQTNPEPQTIGPWEIGTEPPAPPAEAVDHCPKCGKEFRGKTANSAKNAVRMHDLRVHTPGGGRGFAWKKQKAKTTKSLRWSPERRARFERTWRARRKAAKAKAKNKAQANSHNPPVATSTIQFCPRCGCNVEVVRRAIEFADNA